MNEGLHKSHPVIILHLKDLLLKHCANRKNTLVEILLHNSCGRGVGKGSELKQIAALVGSHHEENVTLPS